MEGAEFAEEFVVFSSANSAPSIPLRELFKNPGRPKPTEPEIRQPTSLPAKYPLSCDTSTRSCARESRSRTVTV